MSDDSELDEIIRTIPSQLFRMNTDDGDQPTAGPSTVSNSIITVSSGSTVSNSHITVSSGDDDDTLLLYSNSTPSYDHNLMTLWDYSPPGNLDSYDMNANRGYLDAIKVMDLESQK